MKNVLVMPRSISSAVLVLLCFLSLHGCSVKIHIPEIIEIPAPSARIQVIALEDSIHPSWKTTIKEYEFQGDIVQAGVDSSGHYLAVIYKTSDAKKRVLLPVSTDDDLSKQALQVPYSAVISSYGSGNIHLHDISRNKLILIDGYSGKIAKELPGRFIHGPFDGAMLQLDTKSYSLWDQDSGVLLWQREHDTALNTSHRRSWRIGDHVFIVGNGLLAASLDGSSEWYYNTQTGGKSYAKLIAGEVFGIVASVLTGTFVNTGGGGGDYTYGLYSNPLVVDEHVYFASGDHLARLSLHDGKIVWQRPLPGRSGTASLLMLNEKLGVLVEYGSDEYNDKIRETKNPYVSVFDFQTGEEK